MTADARWIPVPTNVAYDALTPGAPGTSAFAAANGWQHHPLVTAQPLPGVVFRDAAGRSRFTQRAGDVVRLPGSAALEVGNSAYTYTVQMNQMSAEWGYVAVRLPRATPALVVETRSARAVRPLPAVPDVAPLAVSAEPERAAVYAAPENAEWAQAVVTEEIVDFLDQDGMPLDLEIAEGWLFLYRPGRLSVPDPLVWRRVFGILDALDVSLSAAAGSLAGAGPFPALPKREQVARTTRHAMAKYVAAVGGLFIVVTGGAYVLFGR
ncbi:hypothetical protein [Microbacterium testaceum]|uniref:hypothetical protein n=1 Tax=Microbacterium testaceum TaxID=2033 RepID=UPI0038245C99